MSYEQSRATYGNSYGRNKMTNYEKYKARNQMVEQYEKDFYSDGNLAYEINPKYQESNRNNHNNVEPRRKNTKNKDIRNKQNKQKSTSVTKSANQKPKVKQKVAKKPEKRISNRERFSIITSFHWKTLAISIFMFVGTVALIASKVQVDSVGVDIRRTREELKSLREQNAILTAERMEEIDLEYIKKEATERLNMSEPQPYQIVYIDVPKQSYTIQHNSGL